MRAASVVPNAKRAGPRAVRGPGRGGRGSMEVPAFGSNPGGLKMLLYAPTSAPRPGAPLIVVLHGCGQDAAGFAREAGWLALADRLSLPVVSRCRRAKTTRAAASTGSAPSTRGAAGARRPRSGRWAEAATGFRSDPKRIFVTGSRWRRHGGGALPPTRTCSPPAPWYRGCRWGAPTTWGRLSRACPMPARPFRPGMGRQGPRRGPPAIAALPAHLDLAWRRRPRGRPGERPLSRSPSSGRRCRGWAGWRGRRAVPLPASPGASGGRPRSRWSNSGPWIACASLTAHHRRVGQASEWVAHAPCGFSPTDQILQFRTCAEGQGDPSLAGASRRRPRRSFEVAAPPVVGSRDGGDQNQHERRDGARSAAREAAAALRRAWPAAEQQHVAVVRCASDSAPKTGCKHSRG